MAHLYCAYKCNLCRKIPEIAPLYHCPNRHQYCQDCHKKLQRSYTGSVTGGATCLMCQFNGRFQRNEVSTELLRKLKHKPGIGRASRYSPSRFAAGNDRHLRSLCNRIDHVLGQAGETPHPPRCLFGMAAAPSRRPLRCLHAGCHKSVAVSSYVSHFRHDHRCVTCHGVERGQMLYLFLDVADLRHGQTRCLAMITVYQSSHIEVRQSRSSQSVLNAVDRLCSKVPVNTFWLMLSGSPESRRSDAHAVLWVFSNSEERFFYTLELSSRNDGFTYSMFATAVGLLECRGVDEVVKGLNCFFVSYGNFVSLLSEGDKINVKMLFH